MADCCHTCGGTGRVTERDERGVSITGPCWWCRGTGAPVNLFPIPKEARHG